jgi:hypothetical protein
MEHHRYILLLLGPCYNEQPRYGNEHTLYWCFLD